jgi:type III pantothenate kinase
MLVDDAAGVAGLADGIAGRVVRAGLPAGATIGRVIIAVDIGNSAVKAALVDGSTLLESGRLSTSGASTADLADGLRTLAGHAPAPPERIVAVSVVDRWTERLERAAEDAMLPLTVLSASHVPLGTALLRPDQAGQDRLLAAWTAAEIHGSPVIVVDLGTATTVDAVDGDGFFLGGAILPGLGLAADALAEGTAKLPRVDPDLPADAIGTDTRSAIVSGVVIGHLGAVRELITRMRGRLAGRGGAGTPDGGVGVIVTGGYSAAAWAREAWLEPAAPALPAIASSIDPDLVLRGLGMLSERMATRPARAAP